MLSLSLVGIEVVAVKARVAGMLMPMVLMLAPSKAMMPMGITSLRGMASDASSTWGVLCGSPWPRASSGGERGIICAILDLEPGLSHRVPISDLGELEESVRELQQTTKDSVPLLKSQVLYSLIKGTRASLQGTRASPNTCTQHVVRKP